MAKHRSNPLDLVVPGYFNNVRPEVIEFIAAAGLRPRQVLELGCAAGGMAQALQKRISIERYVGLELNEVAAEQARTVLTQVHVVDVSTTSLQDIGINEESFDLLVALDILEHLYNPWDVLARYGRALARGGYLVASIPNIANVSIIQDLVRGRWTYAAAGLLDATHLRFFTLETIQELCAGAGFQVLQVHRLLNPNPNMTNAREDNNTVNVDNMPISAS